MRSCAWILLFAATSAAWQPASTRNNLAATHRPAATRAPAVTAAVRVEKLPIVSSISQLVEFGRADPDGLLQTLVQQAKEDPSTLLQLVKDAGIAGAISYTVVELTFFAIALPIGYFSWHASTGEWLQPLLLLQEDGVEGKARLLGLLLSYVVLLKTLFPLRLGSTLLLTPVTQRALSGLPALGGLSQGGARGALKSELLELAEAARGGVVALGAEERARFDEIVAELRELNPTDAPASAATLTGAWECRWTSEKEINFAVEKGLFGEPWVRTTQTIDVAAGTLENRIEFEDGRSGWEKICRRPGVTTSAHCPPGGSQSSARSHRH